MPTAPPRIGIGIITYNRKDLLLETVRRVQRHTSHPHADLVVADDGSTDGTPDALRALGIPLIGGANRGIAWNKNRALYLLGHVLRCEVVILLEDDTQPAHTGWEQDWITATRRWGHVNLAADWIADSFGSGQGTPDNPYMGKLITAQCAGYARDALDFAGYFDTRFKGFGHEHVEHTRRLVRAGYGGTEQWVDGVEHVRYALLASNLTVHTPPSHYDQEQVDRNLLVAHEAMADPAYRVPWRTPAEMVLFRDEIRTALECNPKGFALHDVGGLGSGVVGPASAMDYLRGQTAVPPAVAAPSSSAPPIRAPWWRSWLRGHWPWT